MIHTKCQEHELELELQVHRVSGKLTTKLTQTENKLFETQKILELKNKVIMILQKLCCLRRLAVTSCHALTYHFSWFGLL